ncbi:MAG: hypothetical protein ACREIA_26735 [Opitutaceae bacterium]
MPPAQAPVYIKPSMVARSGRVLIAAPGSLSITPVEIAGAMSPDDTQVDGLYRRPPYISLQIVNPGYPLDGSEPLWSGNWQRALSGRISIPHGLLSQDGVSPESEYLLYVEVRDFQYNTFTGSAPLRLNPKQTTTVHATAGPDGLLPSLR